MNLIKLSLWAKKNGYSYRGAYNRFHAGRIEGAFKNETGRIVVPVEESPLGLRTIVYARVSSLKQKKDLERQAERMQTFCVANGWIVEEVVTEIASGLNDKRPKLEKILKAKTPIRLVVEHKDRLTRFGFHYIETLMNGEVIVANKTDLDSDSDKEDLMQDLISIITSMVARYYGQRCGSRKAKELIEKL